MPYIEFAPTTPPTLFYNIKFDFLKLKNTVKVDDVILLMKIYSMRLYKFETFGKKLEQWIT